MVGRVGGGVGGGPWRLGGSEGHLWSCSGELSARLGQGTVEGALEGSRGGVCAHGRWRNRAGGWAPYRRQWRLSGRQTLGHKILWLSFMGEHCEEREKLLYEVLCPQLGQLEHQHARSQLWLLWRRASGVARRHCRTPPRINSVDLAHDLTHRPTARSRLGGPYTGAASNDACHSEAPRSSMRAWAQGVEHRFLFDLHLFDES
jgi:hypothetical protein